MRKKAKWVILCSYLILIFISLILANILFSEHQTLADVFLWISATLIGLLVIFLIAIIFIIKKGDEKLFKSHIENKDFTTARLKRTTIRFGRLKLKAVSKRKAGLSRGE